MQRLDASEPIPRAMVRRIAISLSMATVSVVLLVLLGANPLILLVLPSLGVMVAIPLLFRAAERKRQRSNAS